MILIVDCGSKKTPYIEEIIDDFIDYKTKSILTLSEDDLNDVIGIVISGAPLLITEMDLIPYINKTNWIKTTNLPILGICFGHQLIGLHFGAYGSKIKEDRDLQIIGILEYTTIFDKLPDEFEMMEDHCETISIPADFNLIASSDACVNEAMQHKSKSIFGVQFHPEVSGNLGRVIFENFVKICETNQSNLN